MPGAPSPATSITALVELLTGLGCVAVSPAGRLSVTSGDGASAVAIAGAVAGSTLELLDVWQDTDPAAERVSRRCNLLVADGSKMLVHRAILGEDEALPALASVLPGALPYLIDAAGSETRPDTIHAKSDVGAASGTGVFTLPFGPVRSGVVEAMLFEIDTAGEDMLIVRPRPGFKRRGLEDRMCERPLDEIPLVAERIAGVHSIAGALAVCHAVEDAANVSISSEAAIIRMILAELERVYNHCDSLMKLCDDASLVVGTAQMGILKERILRVLAQLTGHRFGRGVVNVGGIRHALPSAGLLDDLRRIDEDSARIRRLLLRTNSFLDRLQRTGRLSPDVAERLGSSGPVARGSQLPRDARVQRSYGAYRDRAMQPHVMTDCDAMARTEVRMAEIRDSIRLVVDAVTELDGDLSAPLRPELRLTPGSVGIGCVESPEGEWIAVVETGANGMLARVRVRPASIANFACFQRACEGWVLTDFAFIEHSFGLSIAGRDR